MHLHFARQLRDALRRIRDAQVVFPHRAGVGGKALRHLRQHRAHLGVERGFDLQRTDDLDVERFEILGEHADLLVTLVDARAHLLREAAELRGFLAHSCGRDLHVEGERAQIAQEAADFVDLRAQRLHVARQPAHAVAARLDLVRQRVQAFGCREQVLRGTADGLGIERLAERTQNLELLFDERQRILEERSRPREFILDLAPRRFELGYERVSHTHPTRHTHAKGANWPPDDAQT
ncbi:MAG: hypothetical protein EKK41_10235 [Hyphomicrobiales bacterium]|nr:MAG: hypothetical protein EKK41_10235 [Hyphomicrobiales bacterium]